MSIEEIKEILYRAYDIDDEDDYTKECGCFVNGVWLSIKDVLDILKENS